MAKNNQNRNVDYAKLRKWFGAPPLLGNESEEDFKDYLFFARRMSRSR